MPDLIEYKTITAIVVDDELHGRENLKQIIENYCHEIQIVGTADNVVTAKELVGTFNPDVVFLDINMPVLDGFDFLEEYDKRSFMAVFVTAHEEFGIKALKAGAVDYILKPINIKEFKQSAKKLLQLKNKNTNQAPEPGNDKLVLPASHGFDIILFDDIIRLEAEGCYTKVVIKDGKNKLVSRILKDFEDTLPKEKFIRIHKSHLINMKYVKDYSNINGSYVTMTDGSRIDISRRKVAEFITKIKTTLSAV